MHAQAVQEMLGREVDYEREAQNMRDARALFEPADGIVVPRVFEDFSTRRVLTTEFVPGTLLQGFLESNPPQHLRDEFGRKIKVAWDRLYYSFMSYADPHSGNYVFMDDGQLGLLDFGCVQRFAEPERQQIRAIEKVFDGEMSVEDLIRSDEYIPEADLANPDFIATTVREFNRMMVPVLTEGTFDFGDPAYFKDSIAGVQEVVRKRYMAGNPMYVYLYRANFGLRALFLRLGCRLSLREIRRAELARRAARGEA
jgi:aarF domain-containing kinase